MKTPGGSFLLITPLFADLSQKYQTSFLLDLIVDLQKRIIKLRWFCIRCNCSRLFKNPSHQMTWWLGFAVIVI